MARKSTYWKRFYRVGDKKFSTWNGIKDFEHGALDKKALQAATNYAKEIGIDHFSEVLYENWPTLNTPSDSYSLKYIKL